jgi:hypothetical protein
VIEIGGERERERPGSKVGKEAASMETRVAGSIFCAGICSGPLGDTCVCLLPLEAVLFLSVVLYDFAISSSLW